MPLTSPPPGAALRISASKPKGGAPPPAHRIGQTRRVFAYRLIARDTVEEKIVALQDRKRDLADSIVRADEGIVASLTPEDVELLLS